MSASGQSEYQQYIIAIAQQFRFIQPGRPGSGYPYAAMEATGLFVPQVFW